MATRRNTSIIRKLFVSLFIFSFLGSIAVNALPTNVQAKSKIEIKNTSITLCKGNSFTLKVGGTTQKAIWKTSDKKIATVSTNGKVSGKNQGSTKIKATIGKIKLECKVKVREHTYSSATCTELKQCTRCEKEIGKYAAHKYQDTINNATKIGKGYTQYICKNCGSSYRGKYTEYQVTENMAYEDMLKLKSKYPESMSWTNDNYYKWKGGIFSGGYGCAGFAFALSDAAFGYLPAREHNDVNDIKVGDILRINNDTHSIIVIERYDDYVVVAEGNYNASIHWGRTFTYNELSTNCDYILTRYPIVK